MKYFYLFFIALLFLVLPSCGPVGAPPKLEGLWIFNENKDVDDPVPKCFLNLEADGKYTMFLPDYFDYGYWKRGEGDTNMVVFTSKRYPKYYGDFFSLQIKEYTKEGLMVSYTLPGQASRVAGRIPAAPDQIQLALDESMLLHRSEVQYPDSLNPFSYSLNRWRIKPVKPESCREISLRTINYLKHMQALFREQYAQQSKYYGYPYSPSPLLYGQNGIATIDFDKIPHAWKYSFFDDGQAKQSCAILYALFDEKLVIPKGYKRPDELWANLLQQMVNYATTRDYCSGSTIPDTSAVD